MSNAFSQAARIRAFIIDHFLQPAISRGETSFDIRAGDIHRLMGLSNAMPAVCSALGGQKLTELARLEVVGILPVTH